MSFSSTATSSSPAGSYAISGSGVTADNGNYVCAQAAGNATALTITAPTQSGGGGNGIPPTLQELVAQAIILNPFISEPGSSQSNVTTGQTSSSNAFWSYSSSPSYGYGTGGASSRGGNGNGFRGGNAPGGSNNPGTVYPDNAQFGQWLRFTSR